MTFPGAPGIYYGDEVAMSGPNDPGSRGAFPWDPDPSGHELVAVLRRLTALRRRRRSLVEGAFLPVVGSGGPA